MDRKRLIIIGIVVVTIIAGILLTVILVNQQQEVRSRAQTVDLTPTPTIEEISPTPDLSNSTATPTPTLAISPTSACTLPDAPANVLVEYPNCPTETNCYFDSASCKWDPITGATAYTYKITEVETSTVVKTATTSAATTKITFNITSGNTYRCEVSATNACGTGPIGTHSLLCKADGVFPTSATTPTPTTRPTPTSIVLTPTPAPLACGVAGCSATVKCQTGYICVPANNGQSYCAMATYQTACKATPGVAACCSAPVVPTAVPTTPVNVPTTVPTQVIVQQPSVQPTLPPTGDISPTIIVGSIGTLLVIIGGILVFFIL